MEAGVSKSCHQFGVSHGSMCLNHIYRMTLSCVKVAGEFRNLGAR